MAKIQGAIVRIVMGAALAAFVSPAVVASTEHEVRADDVPYVDCNWTPFNEAWACTLPQTFKQGRFTAPPDFRHDDRSVQSRQHAWTFAHNQPGARSHGHTGVFFQQKDGSWMFVPGEAWSPGDPVFLPPAPPAPKRHK